MSRLIRSVSTPLCQDGTTCFFVRLLLVAVGLGVLTLGVCSLPTIAMTSGEAVTGAVLSLAVAGQILIAALFFPMRTRGA